MRAVVFDPSLARLALAKGLGRWMPSLYLGPRSSVQLRELPAPTLPGPEWVKLRPRFAGICGTDLGAVFGKLSPALTPFSSSPGILGHEVLGTVVEAGAQSGHREGDRLAIDPMIHCAVRGRPPCAACQGGHYAGCRRAGESDTFAPGNFIGFHKELGGGWADLMVAHRSQCIRVPAALDDRVAALLEPLSVALHAATKYLPRPDEHVLVIGGGPIAQLQVAALRLLECTARVTVSTMADFQADFALRMGATEALAFAPDQSTKQLAALVGATAYKPLLGADVYAGGFDVVFDCIGSRQSIDQALRLCRPRGTVLLVGAAALVPLIDFTFIWSRELRLIGTLAYDVEDLPGRPRQRTFELAAERALSTSLPLGELVTHTYPLERFDEAIWANVRRGASRAVKTLLAP